MPEDFERTAAQEAFLILAIREQERANEALAATPLNDDFWDRQAKGAWKTFGRQAWSVMNKWSAVPSFWENVGVLVGCCVAANPGFSLGVLALSGLTSCLAGVERVFHWQGEASNRAAQYNIDRANASLDLWGAYASYAHFMAQRPEYLAQKQRQRAQEAKGVVYQ